jgi:hypothetical protein
MTNVSQRVFETRRSRCDQWPLRAHGRMVWTIVVSSLTVVPTLAAAPRKRKGGNGFSPLPPSFRVT